MKFRLTCVAVAVVCLLWPTRLSADVIIDWNNVMLEAIRVDAMNAIRASRVMAMTHTAIYDAVNSIDDTHFPYHVNLNVPSTTSREAAAAQAAHDVLVNVFPAQQATLATALSNSLSGIPAGPAKTDGIALGSSVAGSIITLRANDGSGDRNTVHSGHAAGPMAADAASKRAGAIAELGDRDAVDYDQRFAIPRSHWAAGAFERRVCGGAQRSQSPRKGQQRHAHG